ncbi:efflux RND transporter periplasmic adaptor subunit [Pleionea sp. CnH1-48]|uniref:efflux RND transporter periplasmic adaptor subunit n=1 Tax=Pleionea sp. CnH1-48 TaxID=2954494 RepID=UPI002096FEE3|nr:efflux RND transporter periplasmic adaptor subunit [Pleionea sp. CnH1-48]MCO7224400.1 efflux RND transporter periplasmic adaptor subunit [Pleionea sp. CnH1-48]
MRLLAISLILVTSIAFADDTVEVDIFYPKAGIHQQALQLTGSVEAEQDAGLASLQAGRVAELFVDAGDLVEKGQKLLTLDASLAELSLAEARAALEAAKVERSEAERLYEEVQVLSKRQVVAQTQISERRAQVARAKAELTRQEANVAIAAEVLRRHTLYAPFAGVIAKRSTDIGEWVSQQNEVFTLVKQSALRLKVAIPQQYFSILSKHSNIKINVQSNAVGSNVLNLSVSRLVPVFDQQSRTMSAYIKLPQSSAFAAGMSANAELFLPNQTEPLVWLPKSAIKQHPDGGNSVFAVVSGKAKRVFVNINEQRDDLVAVTQASANLAYVISGVELLRDGQKLKVNKVQGNAL